MFNNTFKIVYFVLFMVAMITRKAFTAKHSKREFVLTKKSAGDFILLFFDGIGMMVPLVYVFSDVLDFADYFLPAWIGWIGVLLFTFAVYLLYRSHADLGKNWSPILGIQKEHVLVTSGIYRRIRHPMYAAHLLWAIAQIMILQNWIAGYSFIAVMVPHYLLRVKREEQMMIDRFGREYEDYKIRSGRIFPKIAYLKR